MEYKIEYYYNLFANNIITINDDYYFYYENIKYCLYKIRKNDNVIYTIELLKHIELPTLISTLVKNKNGMILTTISGNDYVLLKINLRFNRKIIFEDLFYFRKNIDMNRELWNLNKFRWSEMWKTKIDYYESLVKENSNFSFDVKVLMYYFVSIGENAIKYINKVITFPEDKINNKKYAISHNRVMSDSWLIELCNPFGLIIDHESRDTAEYLKSCFIQKKDFNYISNVIKRANLTDVGYELVFSRLLFPTMFFDLLDSSMDFLSNKKIVEMYDLTIKYENFLSFVYMAICEKIRLPAIKWING